MEKLDNSAAEMYPHHRQHVSHKGTGPEMNSYLLQYLNSSEVPAMHRYLSNDSNCRGEKSSAPLLFFQRQVRNK